MILSVNNLNDKRHRCFSKILLLHYPIYDFLQNYFYLPEILPPLFMPLDLVPFHLLNDFCFGNCTSSYTLSIFPSLLHSVLMGTILKKKKRTKRKVSFDPTSSSGYHFIFCSCGEQNFLKRVCRSISKQYTHFFSLKMLYIIFFLLLKK